jgi:hypothetical protein
MFTRIRVAPGRIEVADRAAAVIWTLIGVLVVAFAFGAVATWRDAGGLNLGSGLVTGGFAFALLCAWLSHRLWLVRCRFDAAERRALFERRNLRERQHRFVAFDDIAEIVLRERRDDEGDWVRGIHVVLRDGEKVEVIATDQTDRDQYAPLVDAIRAMVTRAATPPPAPPRG